MLLIFGLDQEGKKIKKVLPACGCDKEVLKGWLLNYKKIKKSQVSITNHYHSVKEHGKRLLAETRELELLLVKDEALTGEESRRFKELLSDFTKTKPLLDFEFVISRADKEIHLTLQGLERLGLDYLKGKSDKLILQSEVENLLALIKEALDKEKPDLAKLAVFYLNHSDRELEEISYTSRLMLIDEVYEKEYIQPVVEPVQIAVQRGLLAGRDAREYLDGIIAI